MVVMTMDREDLMICYDRIMEELEPDFRSQVSRSLGILYSARAEAMLEGMPVPCLHSIFFFRSGEEDDSFEPDFVLQERVWTEGELRLVMETSAPLGRLLSAFGLQGFGELKSTLIERFSNARGYRQVQDWLQAGGVRFYSDVMDYQSGDDGIY